MKLKRYIAAMLAVIVAALAVACTSSTTGGSSGGGGGYHRIPEPWDSGQPAPQASSDQQVNPIPSADAVTPGDFPVPVPPRACTLYIRSVANPIRLVDGLNLGLSAQVVCNSMPSFIIVTLRLQYLDHGSWVDETTPVVDSSYPDKRGDGYYRDYSITALCYPGLWHAIIEWNGIGWNGAPFPNVANGDDPSPQKTKDERMNC